MQRQDGSCYHPQRSDTVIPFEGQDHGRVEHQPKEKEGDAEPEIRAILILERSAAQDQGGQFKQRGRRKERRDLYTEHPKQQENI